MDPLLLQKQVRDNASELNSFLNDLKNWEKEMKRKDKQILESTGDLEVIPPVRSKVKRPKKSDDSVDQSPVTKETKRISSFDYSAWDKFDVEKACADIETIESNESDSEPEVESTDTDVARLREQAMYEKELGNQRVKQQKWKEAIDCYGKAIQCNPYDAVFYANRALCYLKVKKPKLAETDCTTALQLDKTYVKAYQRRALARIELGLKDDAKADFHKVLEFEPNNSAAKSELSKLDRKNLLTTGQKKEISSNQRVEKILNEKPKNKKVSTLTEVSRNEIETHQKRLEGTPDILGACGDARNHEVVCSTIRESDTIILPIQKAPHLRSKKPLQLIHVKEVETFADLLHQNKSPKHGINNSALNNTEKIVELKSEAITVLEKESSAVETIHQTEGQIKPKELVKEVSKFHQEKTSDRQKSTELPPIPKTSMQFFVSWKLIKNDSELRFQFLKQIPGKEMPRLFQESLESKEFGEIISCLATEFISRKTPVFPYLKGLSEVKRFSALVMFMSKSEKNVIKKLLSHCEENGECTKEEVANLVRCYELN